MIEREVLLVPGYVSTNGKAVDLGILIREKESPLKM
jgi:hypothetical protein